MKSGIPFKPLFLAVMLVRIPVLAQQPADLAIVPQTGHYGIISFAQVSRDGEYFVTGTHRQAILWETASGKQVRHFSDASAFAFSGNGKVLATGHADIELWDVISGERLRTIDADPTSQNPKYMPRVSKLILSDEGRYVAGWKVSSNEISVWETATGNLLRTLDVGAKPDRNSPPLVLQSDGKLTLAGGGKLDTFRQKQIRSTCSALSADGNVAAIGNADGTLSLYNAADEHQLHSLNGFQNRSTNPAVTSVALSGDGRVLVTGNTWGMVSVWDVENGKERYAIPPDAGCSPIGLSADGNSLCTSTNGYIQTHYPDLTASIVPDPTVRLWDLKTGTSPFAFSTDAANGAEPVGQQAQADQIARVLSCGPAPTLLWLTHRDRRELFGYSDTGPNAYATSADAVRLATCGMEGGPATVWDIQSGTRIQTFGTGHEYFVNVALSADAGRLATAGLKSTTVWDTVTGQKLRTVDGGFNCLALTPDGSRLYTRSQNKQSVQLWDTETGRNIRTFETGAIGAIVPSSDGRYLVTGSLGDYGEKNTSTLWDVSTGKKRQEVPGHPVSVSSEGGQLWTSDARLWDLAKGNELCRIYSFDFGREWLVVTPEGLVDGSENAWRHAVFRDPGTLKTQNDRSVYERFHRPGLLSHLWNLDPYQGYVMPAAVEMPAGKIAETNETEILKQSLAGSGWKVGKVDFRLKPDGSLGGSWDRLRHSTWKVTGADSFCLIDNQEQVVFLRIKLNKGHQRGDAIWKSGQRRIAYRR